MQTMMSLNFPALNISRMLQFSRLQILFKVLNADAGFIVFPSGERLTVIDDMGEKLNGHKLLMLMLLLIDKSALKKVKVYLPAFAPSVLDNKLENVEVIHGSIYRH